MNEIINKIASKFVIFSVVVLFIAGLPELFASGTALRIALDKAVVENIPFAKIIIDYICKIYDYPNNFSTQTNYLYECTKLFIMSILYPITSNVWSIFLRPSNYDDITDWKQLEDYTDTFSYKLKSFFFSLITFVFLAFGVEHFLIPYKDIYFGIELSPFMILVVIIVFSVLLAIFTKFSMIGSLNTMFSIRQLFIWRLVKYFLYSLLKAQIISVCSVWAYLSIVNEINNGVLCSFTAMIVMLIILEMAVGFITKGVLKS